MGMVPVGQELFPRSPCGAGNGPGTGCVRRGAGVQYLEWELRFPHGAAPWLGSDPAGNVRASHAATLPRSMWLLEPLEYPIPLGRASGEQERLQVQELWALAGSREGGRVGMLLIAMVTGIALGFLWE